VTLERNYRSTQAILDAANALIGESGRQFRKRLASSRGAGGRPGYVTVLDDQAQAQYVVERVLEAREDGVELKRQAVLFAQPITATCSSSSSCAETSRS
jgi:DNA helicase-2/ATP-dependent DNA helicase PcrA